MAKDTDKNKLKPATEEAEKVIASKQFVAVLKKELEGEKIPEPVFKAFINVTKRVDTEENYRKIWKTTFKRR